MLGQHGRIAAPPVGMAVGEEDALVAFHPVRRRQALGDPLAAEQPAGSQIGGVAVNERPDRLPHRRFPGSIHPQIACMALGRGGKRHQRQMVRFL